LYQWKYKINRHKYVFDDERKYHFSLIRGVLRFIPWGIFILLLTFMGRMKASITGYEPVGGGVLLLFISIIGIVWLGRGESRPRRYNPRLEIPRADKVEDDASEESDCLKCGAKIPAGSSKCNSCGWSYQLEGTR
jgi:ribosomal protein L40E